MTDNEKDTLWVFGDSYGAHDDNWIKDLYLTLDTNIQIKAFAGSSLIYAIKQLTKNFKHIKPTDRILFLITDSLRYESHDGFHITAGGIATHPTIHPPFSSELVKIIKEWNNKVQDEYGAQLNHLLVLETLRNKLNTLTPYNVMLYTVQDNQSILDEKVTNGIINFKADHSISFIQLQRKYYELEVFHYTPNHWISDTKWQDIFYNEYNDVLNKLSPTKVQFGKMVKNQKLL
mgnify:CR=1 FL=1|tara:strand:+ start:187 stop:882 length:696 start_codon:yes stop_codon:yes gene_type:complete